MYYSYVFSWLAWSHKGISAYLLGDNKAKQVIVEQLNS